MTLQEVTLRLQNRAKTSPSVWIHLIYFQCSVCMCMLEVTTVVVHLHTCTLEGEGTCPWCSQCQPWPLDSHWVANLVEEGCLLTWRSVCHSPPTHDGAHPASIARQGWGDPFAFHLSEEKKTLFLNLTLLKRDGLNLHICLGTFQIVGSGVKFPHLKWFQE